MSEKIEGLDVDLLAAIINDPGISINDISEQFLEQASQSTIRRYLKELVALGCIRARKETVLRPTEIGEQFLEKCRMAQSGED